MLNRTVLLTRRLARLAARQAYPAVHEWSCNDSRRFLSHPKNRAIQLSKIFWRKEKQVQHLIETLRLVRLLVTENRRDSTQAVYHFSVKLERP